MFWAIALAVASAGVQAYSYHEQQKSARETSRYNEQMKRREAAKEEAEARAAMERGRYDLQVQKAQQKKLRGAQRTAMADSGALFAGSVFDAELDQAFEFGMENAMLSRETAEVSNRHGENATLLKSQADAERWNRNQQSKNAWAGYAGIGLSSAAQGISINSALKE